MGGGEAIEPVLVQLVYWFSGIDDGRGGQNQ